MLGEKKGKYKDDPIEGVERLPKNPAELELYQLMTEQSWDVVRRGWPDFACFRGEELILVEVKPKRSHLLKRSQYRLMSALTQRGIKCYQWTPDEGFKPIVPTMPCL